ncbi:MAG: hypothetical protein KH426_07130 [Streptococcus salivarius]|nr:hypothetical protein [Streptococcus salivarius]
MESIKRFFFSLFNWFYPLVIIILTEYIISRFVYFSSAYKNVLGSVVLSILLISPYGIFRKCKLFEKNTYKKYFIFENIWLMVFTILNFIFPEFEYIKAVWAIAFIGMSVIDAIIEIRKGEEIKGN